MLNNTPNQCNTHVYGSNKHARHVRHVPGYDHVPAIHFIEQLGAVASSQITRCCFVGVCPQAECQIGRRLVRLLQEQRPAARPCRGPPCHGHPRGRARGRLAHARTPSPALGPGMCPARRSQWKEEVWRQSLLLLEEAAARAWPRWQRMWHPSLGQQHAQGT